MLIGDADIFGDRRDVRLHNGRIAEIAPLLDGHIDVDAKGCALIPALHDHHIHLNALAASMSSIRCGPPEVPDEAALISVLRASSGEVRGVGYHDSVAGQIDKAWLDAHVPDRAVRIQHRSGRLWIMNSAALELYGIKSPDGRILDQDANLTRRHPPDLGPVIKALHDKGVTGVTDVTPHNGPEEFKRFADLPLQVCVMGRPELVDLKDPRVGPVKLHYHDHNLPSLDALTDEVRAAHRTGRAVASHCVTRAELMLTLAAIDAAGVRPGDRIEHGAIIDAPARDWIARLGLCVVTQPNFLAERQMAYREEVPKEDHPHLWPLRDLIDANIAVAGGTDAPFGSYDPWAAMDAAVNRPDGFGAGISAEGALALFTKSWSDAGACARTVEIGASDDLILLDRDWETARRSLKDVRVDQIISSTKPQSSASSARNRVIESAR